MNNRQLDLQTIIRNQQNKIIILKQQNKVMNERFQEKLRSIKDEHNRRVIEKEKLIQYLKIELEKERHIVMQEEFMYDGIRVKQKEEFLRQLEKYRYKNSELEKKLQKVIETYQIKQKELQNSIKNLQDKDFFQETSRNNLSNQIHKINKFYHQSKIEQPKRKQILDWTQKLIAYMNKSQNQAEKSSKEFFSFIKNNLQNLKGDIISSLKASSQFQDQIIKEKREILQTIKSIVHEQNKIKNDISQDNDKFWQAIKKQRVQTQGQRIKDLQKQLIEEKKKNGEQRTESANKLKGLQVQRKTLLLAFTQLKALNESREKTYRDQINVLKQTIDNLLMNRQQRQFQFEKQTKVLNHQLISLSERYYENIEIPLQKITTKLDSQIKNARLELQKLTQNKGFISTIQKLQRIMQVYLQEKAKNNKASLQLAEYVRKTRQFILITRIYAQEQLQKKHLQNDRQQRFSKTNNANFDNKIYESFKERTEMFALNMRQIQWKEKENKFSYEVLTLKNQNKKLKEYNDNLQKKISADTRSTSALKKRDSVNRSTVKMVKNQDTNAKYIELEAQNEKLALLKQKYESQYFIEIENLKDQIKNHQSKDGLDQKQIIIMLQQIKQITQFNDTISLHLQLQNSHVTHIRQALLTLNQILLKPIEIFDTFVEKISNCYQKPFNLPGQLSFNQSLNQSAIKSFSKLQTFYQEINFKRQDNINSTNRLFTDLIKILRDNAPVLNRSIYHKNIVSEETQRQNLNKSKISSKQSNIERRIKQIQNLRIKSRQQIIKRLQKIEQGLKQLDVKYAKKHLLSVYKMQELIDKRIEQLKEKAQVKGKENLNELNKITSNAMKDLKNKLNTLSIQNEGLVKQNQFLQSIKGKQ